MFNTSYNLSGEYWFSVNMCMGQCVLFVEWSVLNYYIPRKAEVGEFKAACTYTKVSTNGFKRVGKETPRN